METAVGIRTRRAILWGATGQAKVLRESLEYSGVRVVALFDNDPGASSPFIDCPLFFGPTGFTDWLRGERDVRSVGFLVAVGGDKGRQRILLQDELTHAGLIPLTVVHPRAFVASDAVLAEGSQILAQAAVCAEARLGRACIVNTGATVDHECILGDGVHVEPGAHLAGLVTVGDFSTIGTGAVVLPRLSVGRGAVIGAGAVVLRDVPDGATVVGNPARILPQKEK